LDNIPEYEKSLTPLFTAFVACMSQVHTSLPDSKTDFTLYALDEYLSFAQIMDEPSKKRLHTLIRSKGGILMPAVQYIPKDDKKLQQLLTSSAYAWIYFSVIEEETIKLFKDAVSETEYVYFEKSHSKGESGSSTSTSTKNERVNLINNHLLNGLGTKYEHICYIPNEKVLYLGYTPQANLPKKAEKSVPSDLSEFYAIKYRIDNEEQEDYKNLTFADLFKEKPLSKLEEYKLFKKFEKAKRQGEEAMASFKQAEKLEAVNLELLFSKYMEDKQVVSNKMKMYSIQQRFELFHSYRKIKDDDAAALEFIETHNLFGALPSFFTFNEEDLGEINL